MIDWNKWKELKQPWADKNDERSIVQGWWYHHGSGNGDLFTNTARKIYDDPNYPNANLVLDEMFHWLAAGKRWPDYMSELITTTTHKQIDMTQDPWIMAYCAAVKLNRYDLIRQYKPSCTIFNLPDKWAWRKALLGKPFWWKRFRKIIPYNHLQWFVYVFYGFMELAYKESKIKN